MREKYSLILAAGKGKRMESDVPKSLVVLKGKTLIERTIENLEKAQITKHVTVVGHRGEEVKKVIENISEICFQTIPLGTADAVLSSYEYFRDKKCNIVIMASDMPFVKGESIKNAIEKFEKEKFDLLVVSSLVDKPTGYGRIIRDKKGKLIKIIEEKDCTEEEKRIKEVNSSVYVVKSEDVFESLKKIRNDNKQKEYYLTDIISIYKDEKKKIGTFLLEDEKEIFGINSLKDLKEAENMLDL